MELRIDAILRRLADDAGVEDGHVGTFEGVLLVAGGEQPAGQALRVGGVHLTADRPDVERPPLDLLRTGRYRLSTSSRMPVRSSPSIEMSMKAGMQSRSSPPGAT